MKTIEIIVQLDGQTKIVTKGFAGPECRQASELFEKALGQMASEELTVEFHQMQSVPRQNQQSTDSTST